MIKSHASLSLMINRVINGVKLTKSSRSDLFREFKDKLYFHIQIEEQSIFGLTEFQDGQIVETTRRLYQQHKDIKRLISAIEADLEQGNYVRLTEFVQLMHEHTYLENKIFYPYLDKYLPVEHREKILKEIRREL